LEFRNIKQFRWIRKGVYVPCLILLSLFVLTYFSEATHNVSFENYDPIGERESTSYIPDSSDIGIILTSLTLDVSRQEVEYSFYIQAWLDINVTEIRFTLETPFSSEVLTMNNYGRAMHRTGTGKSWGWYYQVESPKAINEHINGFPQSFPYDTYSIRISLNFDTGGFRPTFNQTFQPTVSMPAMSDWRTEGYSKPMVFTDYGFTLDIGVNIARYTIVSVLQFMIPTTAIYLLMGYSLLSGSSNKLKERITLFLTISVLTLSLYTFLLRQLDMIPLFVQNIAISLVVSNIILFVFSIISSSERWHSRNWDLWALFLASITPIIYLLLSAYNLMNYILQVIIAEPLWIIRNLFFAYLDYRFLLWFIIFQLAFWVAYLSKTKLFKRKAIISVTFLTGMGIVLFNSFKGGISQEIAFTIIGSFMVIVSLIAFFEPFLKRNDEQAFDFDY